MAMENMYYLPEPPGRLQNAPTPPSQTLLPKASQPSRALQRQPMNQNSPAPRQPMNQRIPSFYSPGFFSRKFNKEPVLPRPRRTRPIEWCSAIICLIFSLLLIFFGIATLIIFFVIKPRYPVFDISNANLGTIYFDSPEYFNGDFTFLANFSNPNKKLEVRFEHLDIELFFSDRVIATQALQSFSLRQGEIKSGAVHMTSSLVYLPPKLALELQQKVQSNRVEYNITGNFKVRAMAGSVHFSYWLHTKCQLQMTGPPSGVLVGRNCSRMK